MPSLPEAVRPLAEVETNVVFSTGAATDNKWTLMIERDAAASNSVEVVFGRDADEDGVLGIEERELCVGWDCGEWRKARRVSLHMNLAMHLDYKTAIVTSLLTMAAPLLCCQTLAVQLRRTCLRVSQSIGVQDLGVDSPNRLIHVATRSRRY